MNNPVTLSELSKNWLKLSQPYRPSAFWFWNSDMDLDRMREVIEQMARNGIREFLIHPVHGMEIEFMSDEFFNRYRYALGLTREYGIKVWVYDEYSWPSGTSGGMLLRKHPEHKGWFLKFSKDADGNVSAKPVQSNRILDGSLGAPWTQNERGYLDTLSEDAVRCFIEMNYESIYRECKEFFGSTITGFFTDEPVCMVDDTNGERDAWSTVGMPWTPRLPGLFKERFGYDIEPRYSELAGDGPSQVKRDYWTLVKEIYTETYHGQIGRWCREHGVKYTGHVGEDRLLEQVRFSGSVYQCLKHMDEPGIDMLMYKPEPEDRFIEQVAVTSITRHCGKDRVYCEAFGIAHYDIRLGVMLRCMQMLGAHGINDIALMGFQQSIDGVRKRTYWPPIFDQAPWWPFYPEFRDTSARSVALTSFGRKITRYAILYPQNQLEQTDLFNRDIWDGNDPASQTIAKLGAAVYKSGETFDFIFPEMLDQAHVENGKVIFPYARYDVILAPSDVAYFDESLKWLDDIQSHGGTVFNTDVDTVSDAIVSTGPSWYDQCEIEYSPSNDSIRVYRFKYPDGELFAVRNVSDTVCSISINSQTILSEWDVVTGKIMNIPDGGRYEMLPHSMRYFTITDIAIGAEPKSFITEPILTDWHVDTEKPDMARLTNVQFRNDDTWVDAVDAWVHGNTPGTQAIGIPKLFMGQDLIEMRGEFRVSSIPKSIMILFEKAHLSSLQINGNEVDLSNAYIMPLWDKSCMAVDITPWICVGQNKISGTLKYEPFETSMENDAFIGNWCMPSCDVFLGGSFRLLDGAITADTGDPLSMPIDLSVQGWKEYCGVLNLTGSVDIDSSQAGSIIGMKVNMMAEDAVGVSVDGKSIGTRITWPYIFDINELEAGTHSVTMRISSTSGNILASPSVWGIALLEWLIEQ